MRHGRFITTALVATAAMAIGPAWALATAGTRTYDGRAFTLPPAARGWMAQADASTAWQPKFVGADFTASVAYRLDERLIEAFTAIYFEQGQGREMVGFGNSVVGGPETIDGGRISLPAGAVHEIQARDSSGKDSLIWYYYEVGGWRTTRGLAEQLLYGLRSLAGAPLSRVVALRATCATDCSAARENLKRFSADLDAALPPLH